MLRSIFKGREAVFIAEIGINHNGDVNTALDLVDSAAGIGADAVKFQTFNPEKMYSEFTSSLIEGGSESARSRKEIDFFAKLTLSADDYRVIADRCALRGVEFFSSPFDAGSVDLLESLGVRLYKIASSEVTDTRLLEAVAATGKPVIMSTGISTEDEIAQAVNMLRSGGCPDITLLHCVALYPAGDADLNLKRIQSLASRFGCEVGFSDHSADTLPAALAAGFGARVFEKHFMLDGDFECPDRNVSLTPSGFSRMMSEVRRAIVMAGDGALDYSPSEESVARSARKSIFAARDIPEGAVIMDGDLDYRRPGVGIPVYRRPDVIGRRAATMIAKDHLIRWEHLS